MSARTSLDGPPRVLVVPPDERPCHTRDLRLLADLGGGRVVLPPSEALPRFRTAADLTALWTWLQDAAQEADAAVASLDALAHGGLIPSRLGSEPGTTLTARLAGLRDLRLAHPHLPVAAAMVVQRCPDVDDATEEPEYWAEHGRALHALGIAWHRAHRGHGPRPDPAAHGVPDGVARDMLARRLRNHQGNVAAVELAADGVVAPLLLTSDDTAPEGLPRLERDWLAGWIDRLGLDQQVHQHPGADEVAGVLLARTLLAARAQRPTVALRCADPRGLDRIAPYEDRPVGQTASAQIAAAGARPLTAPATLAGSHTAGDEAGDVTLVVHPPAAEGGDWALAPPAALDPGAAAATADVVERALAERGPVAVADCAHANGSDPALTGELARRRLLGALAAYAGWNTAGNSLGSAVAAGLLAQEGAAHATQARERLLVTRLAEDHAYQSVVRSHLRARVGEQGRPDPDPHGLDDLAATLPAALTAELAALGDPLLDRWEVTSATIPWGRTFHVEATVAPRAGGSTAGGSEVRDG